jgi:hypothetical protein
MKSTALNSKSRGIGIRIPQGSINSIRIFIFLLFLTIHVTLYDTDSSDLQMTDEGTIVAHTVLVIQTKHNVH